jgi:hypothetical protein
LYILTRDLLLLTKSGKRQTSPLVRESTPHQQTRNCLTEIKSGRKPQMGALFQDGLADWTVGRNITQTQSDKNYEEAVKSVPRVEEGSNTSTVALRVAGGDEKGSLESEAVKYGHESHGIRTREWLRWRGPAAVVNDRPVFLSERVPHINKPAAVWK